MTVLADILILVVLVLANGLFAMAEIAIVSARKGRLQTLADEGDAGAAQALALAEEPNRFLSAVQIGITLIGTLAGVFGGAALAEPLAGLMANIPWLAPYAESLSFVVVVVLITYLSLVLGELAPKRIGLSNAEQIATLVARPMTTISRITAPLIALLSASTNLVIRLAGIRPSEEPPVTEEEILLMLDVGREAGVFAAAEQDIVENVFRFADRRVSALITPYTELEWLDVNDSLEEHWQQIQNSSHSCFPVADVNLDNLLGIVCIRDLWQCMTEDEPLPLRELVQPPLLIPENASALKLLSMVRRARMHEALVVDEHGGIIGMVTLTDVLESLIGDMMAPGEHATLPIVAREDGSWLVDGLLPVDEFEDFFGVDIAPAAEQAYQTVGGFLMDRLDHIPSPADVMHFGGMRFEIMDMDNMRVDKVLVERITDDKSEDDTA